MVAVPWFRGSVVLRFRGSVIPSMVLWFRGSMVPCMMAHWACLRVCVCMYVRAFVDHPPRWPKVAPRWLQDGPEQLQNGLVAPQTTQRQWPNMLRILRVSPRSGISSSRRPRATATTKCGSNNIFMRATQAIGRCSFELGFLYHVFLKQLMSFTFSLF